MINSMTAFARVEHDSPFGMMSWELRSVNHRYLEMALRLPEDMRSSETVIRERINAQLKRGKVDASFRFKANQATDTEINLDKVLAGKLVNALMEIHQLMPQPEELKVDASEILRWPGVIQPMDVDQEQLMSEVLSLLDKALAQLIDNRQREGEKLKSLIAERCDGMSELVEKAKMRLPDVLENYRQRLLQRFEELRQAVDEQRLEQEIVMVAQKMDVAEELDRIVAHISEVQHVLAKGGPVGRRLDFLMQEFNREANTLGSKSMDVETTRISVDMKVLIEQMREQIQNIE